MFAAFFSGTDKRKKHHAILAEFERKWIKFQDFVNKVCVSEKLRDNKAMFKTKEMKEYLPRISNHKLEGNLRF